MTDIQRKTLRLYLIAALLVGVGFWILDALLDFLYFYRGQGTFLDLLAFHVPRHEIYIRTTFLAALLLGAGAIAGLAVRKRRTELALRDTESRLAAALDSSLDAIMVTRLSDGLILEMNTSVSRVLGYEPHETLGRTTTELGMWADPADRNDFASQLGDTGQAYLPQVRIRNRDGAVRHASITASLLTDGPDGQVLSITRDVTDVIEAQSELRRSKEHFYNVLESTTDAYFEMDRDFTITSLNSKCAKEMRHDRAHILGRNLFDVLPEGRDTVFHERYLEAMREQRTLEFEAEYEAYGIWVEVHCYPTPDKLSVYFRDITERREEARRLRDALRQNEIMLKEIHHRVKNNMQVVSSLLSLQTDSPDDPARALRETQGRIRSMALVHEELYRSGDMARIDFQEYASNLAQRVFESHAGTGLTFDARLESLHLSLDKAVPLGLVLNELLTNAVRHAFPDGRQGMVRIQAHAAGDGVTLEVSDDGVGLPPGFALERQQSMGTQIVLGLVEQLRGRLEYADAGQGNGTRVTIRLPAPEEGA